LKRKARFTKGLDKAAGQAYTLDAGLFRQATEDGMGMIEDMSKRLRAVEDSRRRDEEQIVALIEDSDTLRDRIAALEAEVAQLRGGAGEPDGGGLVAPGDVIELGCLHTPTDMVCVRKMADAAVMAHIRSDRSPGGSIGVILASSEMRRLRDWLTAALRDA
jgi:hypothetical protein